ncbi:hypothetical protein M514_08658 [Trichuris suis]|uniref:CCHC-type domain-containing protein n=1 Tax=Trichuris suis TaxID=68888 RepID=A0A085N3G8_9BILA|nr:hypothetical protein M514_08658 [Trichuris suis]
MPIEDQSNLEKVKERLLAAFAPDPFMAFQEFKVRRLRDGETPDAFLPGLRQLAQLAGGVSETAQASAFVDGLPEPIQESMRAGARMESLTLDELLTRARAMLARGPSGCSGLSELVAAAGNSTSVARSHGADRRCYACGGRSHFARECPTRHREAGRPQRNDERPAWRHGRGSGMQGIPLLGGLLLGRDGHVRFNPPAAEICAAAEAGLRVEEKDFIVTCEPATRSWTTAWKWAGGNAPEVLHNRIEEYPPASSVKASYEEELEIWVRNGWLIPYDERDLWPAKGLIPLMAVVRRSKDFSFRSASTRFPGAKHLH